MDHDSTMPHTIESWAVVVNSTLAYDVKAGAWKIYRHQDPPTEEIEDPDCTPIIVEDSK